MWLTFSISLLKSLREIMAELGFRTINEMVGQADALSVRNIDAAEWKLKDLDFSAILYKAPENGLTFYNTETQDHGLS